MAENSAGIDAGELAVVDGHAAIDDDIGHAGREGQGLGEGGRVLDGIWIKNKEIGGHAGGNAAAVIEVKEVSRERTHLADGSLEGDDLLVADVFGEDADEGAEGTGVGVGGGAGIGGLSVRIDADPGGAEGEMLL